MAAVVADPRVTGVGRGCCAPASPVVSNRPRARQTARRGNQVVRGIQVILGKLKSLRYRGWLAAGAADAGTLLPN